MSGTAIARFTVVDMIGDKGAVGGSFTTDLGNWTGKGLTSALLSPLSGACLGWERIDTMFGERQ